MKIIPFLAKPSILIRVQALVLGVALSALSTQAAVLTWDADTGSAGAQDGDGSWDTVTTQWWDGSTDVLWTNADNNTAVFGAGTGTGGSVTLPTGLGIVAGGITFNTNYTLANASAVLTLTNRPVITTAAGTTNTILATLIGDSFTKEGPGWLVLNPSASDTNTGVTVINNGTVSVGGNDSRIYINGDLIINPNGTYRFTSGGSGGPGGGIPMTATVVINGGILTNANTSKYFICNKVVLDNGGSIYGPGSDAFVVTNTDARSGLIGNAIVRLGTNNLVKSTAGLVTITNRPNSQGTDGYKVTMNAGQLIIDKTPNAARRVLGVLTLGGGSLILTNSSASAATTESSIANTVVKPGASTVVITNTGAGNGAVNLVTLARSAGGTLDVRVSGPSSASSYVSTTSANTSGILGGWLTFAGSDWGMNNGGNVIAAYTAYQTSADPTAWISTDNVSLSGNPSAPLDDRPINSLRVTAASTVTLNPGKTLSLASGGLLVTGTDPVTITGGSLQGSPGGDLVVLQNSSGDLTLDTVLSDNSGATSLTKSGSGKLILTGTDSLSGTNYLNGGVVEVDNLNKLASGPLVMNGGTLHYTGGDVNSARSITVNGLGAILDVSPGTTFTQSGAISGSGAALGDLGGLAQVGAGKLVLTASNYFNGATVVSNGTLIVNGTQACDTTVFGAGNLVVYGGTLGGTGEIRGPVMIKSGGTLSPGESPGTITLDTNLTFESGSANLFEVTNAPGASDQVIVQGNLTIGSGCAITLSIPGTPLEVGTYTLIQYSGTRSGSFNSTPILAAGSVNGSYRIDDSTPGQVNLVVGPQVAITSQPTDTVVSVGDDATFTVGASGTAPLFYQWYSYGDDTNNPPTRVMDATNASYIITNAQPEASGFYSVVVSNDYNSVTSSIASLFVGNVAPMVTGPTDETVIAGHNITFTASVFGNPNPDLQWRTNGVDVAGATGTSLTLNNVPYALDGTLVSLVATNLAGSKTNSATLSVIVTPSISPQPTSLTVNVGDPAVFTSGATGVPTPTLQWYKNTMPLSGETGSTLTIGSAQGSDIATYTLVASNAAGVATSSGASLSVYSTTLAKTALSPANGASGICLDTPLYVTFNSGIGTVNAGQVRIYNVTSPGTPVDILDMSSNTVVVNGSVGVYNVQSRTIGGAVYRTFPVLLISSNIAAIYPHSGVLAAGQSYYVTVDGGVFTDNNGAFFPGITNTTDWQFTTKASGPANPTNLVVAADGSGDFCTVQGAVDFVPSGNTNYTSINIRNGVYREIVFLNTKNNVTFRGQDRHQTIVTYVNNDPLNGGTSARPMFRVRGNDVAIENMTLTNATPKGGLQAEALRVGDGSKRFIGYQDDFDSFQDTILINNSGDSAYFQDCHVQGDTDFIWGSGTIFFTNCEIMCMSSQSHITQARTDPITNGIAFISCQITRASGVVTNCDLGRDGGGAYPYGQVAYVNCSMDTNAIIPAGWIDGGLPNKSTLRFWEYQSTDLTGTNLIDVSQRASWSQQIDFSTATNVQDVLFWLYGWTPQLPAINTAPTLNPIGDLAVNPGATATLTAVASDPDVPFQSLAFSLVTAPPEATLGISSGDFSWRVPVALADTTNLVTIMVSDNGSPNLSATQSFHVIVNPLTNSTLGSVTYSAGQFAFTVGAGSLGPDYIVLVSTNLVNWQPIFTNASPVTPFGFTDTNAAAFSNRFYRIQLAP